MKTPLILCMAIALPVAGGCRKKEERRTGEPAVETTGKPVEAPSAPEPHATTPESRATAPSAPESHATAPTEKAGKPAVHKRRLEAIHEPWDIGEATPRAQADAARRESAAHPEVRAPAATVPSAPAEHASTRFVTIHPARRISGETLLSMPTSLAQELVSREVSEMDFRGRLCMDDKGVPAFIEPIQKTGVPAADHEVERAVMGWRYQPYVVAGKPQPFCTGVRFRFILKESTDVED